MSAYRVVRGGSWSYYPRHSRSAGRNWLNESRRGEGNVGFRLIQEPLEDTGQRVLRGGAWNNFPQNARSATRLRFDSTVRYLNYGFRLIQESLEDSGGNDDP